MQGCKVSTLPDGPRNVERRSACECLPTKSEDSHAQRAFKIDYCRSVPMVGATQVWCTNKDDLSGPGIAIPGARPGPEHGVWAPLSSLSWSLTGVAAARAGRHHPRRARSRTSAVSKTCAVRSSSWRWTQSSDQRRGSFDMLTSLCAPIAVPHVPSSRFHVFTCRILAERFAALPPPSIDPQRSLIRSERGTPRSKLLQSLGHYLLTQISAKI